mmetsp:Transcript_22366/g.29256  ORF Transcript_22366/g.29256 Transcript_22366/m.29256 type:complete len:340 (+) Transcript_22366:48-1067(+)
MVRYILCRVLIYSLLAYMPIEYRHTNNSCSLITYPVAHNMLQLRRSSRISSSHSLIKKQETTNTRKSKSEKGNESTNKRKTKAATAKSDKRSKKLRTTSLHDGSQKKKKGRVPKTSRKSGVGQLLGRIRETALLEEGFSAVIGADEAGRGPLAGPVVGAACYLPQGVMIEGVMDSKKVTKEEEREKLYEIITRHEGVIFATHAVDAKRIDDINILNAALEAMKISAEKVAAQIQEHQSDSSKGRFKPFLLVDGNRLPKDVTCNAEAVVKGDASEYCIAAASILAKVTRDRMMAEYDEKWPAYEFKKHKGYPTSAHMQAIGKYGPCPIHRMTFHPLKKKR